jgi:hypothetical protein
VFAHSYRALRTLGAAARGALPDATLAVLPGCGHEAIDATPGLAGRELAQFLA